MLASCNVMQYSSLQCNILKTKSCLFHYSTILLLRVLAFPFYTLFWKPAMEVHQKWHSSIFKTAVVKLWYKSPTTKMVHTSVHVCKRKKHTWHQTMRVHACKINAPHTRTYPYETSIMKRSSLQPVVT